MPLIDRNDGLLSAFFAASLLAAAPAVAQSASKPEPLVVQDQGSFTVGGTVITAPGMVIAECSPAVMRTVPAGLPTSREAS